MSLKNVLFQAYTLGKNNSDFNDWWDQWKDSDELKQILRNEVKSDLHISGKNIITPGSVIVAGGDFHLGDKK
jgi:hypothetical protein